MLGDRYVIEARLGDGAMGTVYRARHLKFGRAFAIKVLHPGLVTNAKVVRRFEREAELAGRLRHTNVVSVVDVGITDDGSRYTAMELAPGTTLANLIADGPLSEARVLDLAKQLCSGLQHAHDLGLVHRDFKPENVIVEHGEGGREVARIVDWGVAILREHAADADADDRLTTKGIVVGTPHYMAPEQARGGGIDHRVDLFALGLICYELLTGRLPFDGNGVDIARANMEAPTPPMAERAPGIHVDPVLEAVVRVLLAKDPDARPASGNAARELFELFEHDRASCARRLGVELEAPPPPAPDLSVRADPERDRETEEVVARDRRGPLAIVAAAVAVALACMLWLGLRERVPAAAPAIAVDAREEIAITAVPSDTASADRVPVPAPLGDSVDLLAPAPRPTARPVAKKPAPTAPAAPSTAAPSAAEVATLYGAVGRELKALDNARGMDATIELWPRYRWIRINEWLATPERRARIAHDLERLRAEIRARD